MSLKKIVPRSLYFPPLAPVRDAFSALRPEFLRPAAARRSVEGYIRRRREVTGRSSVAGILPQGSAVSGVCAAPGSAIAALPAPGASAPDPSSFVCLPVSCVPGEYPAEPSFPLPPLLLSLGEPGQPLPRSPSDRRRPYPPTAPWPRFCQSVFRSICRCGWARAGEGLGKGGEKEGKGWSLGPSRNEERGGVGRSLG